MNDFPTSLLDGYRTFRGERFVAERARYRILAEKGQTPEVMVIACCDSRAAPETIFNAVPGQIFVLRNVANLVPPYHPDGEYHGTSAALEFAVQSLKVRHVVVLGHGACGGIQLALDQSPEPLSPGGFIGKWMDLLAVAAEEIGSNPSMTPAERQLALERVSIRRSIGNLRTFPWVSIPERKGRMQLHGAWFNIAGGDLWIMDSESGEFAKAPA